MPAQRQRRRSPKSSFHRPRHVQQPPPHPVHRAPHTQPRLLHARLVLAHVRHLRGLVQPLTQLPKPALHRCAPLQPTLPLRAQSLQCGLQLARLLPLALDRCLVVGDPSLLLGQQLLCLLASPHHLGIPRPRRLQRLLLRALSPPRPLQLLVVRRRLLSQLLTQPLVLRRIAFTQPHTRLRLRHLLLQRRALRLQRLHLLLQCRRLLLLLGVVSPKRLQPTPRRRRVLLTVRHRLAQGGLLCAHIALQAVGKLGQFRPGSRHVATHHSLALLHASRLRLRLR
mmetsp:Transcript_26724/g.85972  ORF Transcript_26724/g.85972 Transcript_26724/m.85972 type:complete len:282 (-) Transcript_26724:201-1046(-)